MKAPYWSTCTEEELWKYVASYLAKHGVDTLLVGGAVVAIYTDGAYRSGDLDLVLLNYLNERLPGLMKDLGFSISQSRHYSHPLCKHLIIDFMSGPAGIGEDRKIKPDEVTVGKQIIKLYSPTDCIRDRLASYIHFNARECLDQAVMVAKKYPFDRSKVRKWCKAEGAPEAFGEFESKLVNSANLKFEKSEKSKVHPWRVCPIGEHAVRTHPLKVRPSKNGKTTRHWHWHCAHNPSGKDQLFALEISEIAKIHFSTAKPRPCSSKLKFPNGSKFDVPIAGWTKYWNEVLKPDVVLDPNLVKALIASESGFRPSKLADKDNSNSARGLTQILNATRKILGDEKGELKNHFVTATKEELNNPDVNICAGIRWLFHKRYLASSRTKSSVTWEEAVAEYKDLTRGLHVGEKRAKELFTRFLKYFEEYKKCSK